VAVRRDPVQLTDFYPTICRLLGLPTPATDGEVVSELVPAER
jgi:arylsulfatase A-like enzyme